ncbi:MAG TPA: UdgX family uracil-DNA binding protein [Solirubrobacteraceae bacterium]|nr:UdgX family uracil-DNA binding protein [Solirubrobacteraceae bacterium]
MTATTPPDAYPPAPIPEHPSQEELRRAEPTCRACDLWEPATQVVPGRGPNRARVMLVGEQPGDREDRAGEPFVGPAGRVLDEGLERAGVVREDIYVTNVVKHFRYKLRGKRRIHQTPDRWQVSACLPWLEAELSIVHPEVLVCLGATAAKALLGPSIRVGRDHGQPLDSELAPKVTLTAHPSSILRLRGDRERAEAMETLVADLRAVAGWL